MLLSPLAASVAAESYQTFLGRYEPSTNVDDIAALDLDQRSIAARLAAGTYAGLREDEEIYSKGRAYDSAATAAIPNRTTLRSLGTIFAAGDDQMATDAVMGVGSPTYESFVEYYGGQDYPDRWIQAAFDGIAVDFDEGDADFSKLDLEGRSGERYCVFFASLFF